jgi:SAM-dependent methyltransferase
MKLKLKALLSGLATYIPGYDYARPTGGTGSARYCYSVWLRHLILGRARRLYSGVPVVAAELGPGDSLGIGLAALLSGVQRYRALDIVRYSDLARNLDIFEELVSLFDQRAPVPGEEEFPLLLPRLATYEFPQDLLDEEWLREALDPQRVHQLRTALTSGQDEHSRIQYVAPWSDPSLIRDQSVDLIYSQAVLEHIDDLPGVYRAMRRWLKPGGAMSHQIDFQCHGKADTWNGHWTYSDFAWRVVVGRRSYLLNREPYSTHMRLLRDSGFTVVHEDVNRSASLLRRESLARRYRALSATDLSTSGSFVLATAPG